MGLELGLELELELGLGLVVDLELSTPLQCPGQSEFDPRQRDRHLTKDSANRQGTGSQDHRVGVRGRVRVRVKVKFRVLVRNYLYNTA